MHHIAKNKVGLAFAAVLGGFHLVWAILVAVGLAQPLLDFIYRIHMLKPVFVVDSFSFGLSIILIIVTAVIGYAVGYIFAVVFNYLHR